MSSGGSQTSSTQSIPGWLQTAGQQYLQQAGNVASTPYTPYTGQRVAGLTPLQRSSIQGFGDLAGGTPSLNAADDMLTSTLRGQNGNPYAGDNPYFRQSLQTGLGDLTDAYNRGTAADTTRMFNQAGAFGGSTTPIIIGAP